MKRYGKLNETSKGDFNVIEFDNNFLRVADHNIHPDCSLHGEDWDSVEFELVDGLANITKVIPTERTTTKESRVLNLKDTSVGEIVEYALHVRSQKYERLLIIQRRPKEAIYFKDQEITPEKLIEILENIEIN
jgi:hypothetical protein